ncbi:MAG: hypothetical protein EHM61_15980 [Acidobacteria bacterium]|nr:MAG: hypothetical protein EHM61_15980 [Acidobacteriota bacterium]
MAFLTGMGRATATLMPGRVANARLRLGGVNRSPPPLTRCRSRDWAVFRPAAISGTSHAVRSNEGVILRIGLTIWNGRVSPVFDVSHQLAIYKTSDREILREAEIPLPEDPFAKVRSLASQTLDVVICGAVSGWIAEAIESSGIKLFPFVAGEAGPVLQAFLRGEVRDPSWSMPGCCRGRRQGRPTCCVAPRSKD